MAIHPEACKLVPSLLSRKSVYEGEVVLAEQPDKSTLAAPDLRPKDELTPQQVKILSGTLSGAVAAEAKRVQSSWVILDNETFELHQSLFRGTSRISDLNFFSLLSAGSTILSSMSGARTYLTALPDSFFR
ncbi:hypothetical protein JHK85_018311 [Glycine max]|nr:hypothetical protein JHK85_018311 [Glycine max]